MKRIGLRGKVLLALAGASMVVIVALLVPGLVPKQWGLFYGIGDFPGGYVPSPGQTAMSSAEDISHNGIRVVGSATEPPAAPTVVQGVVAIGWTEPQVGPPFWSTGAGNGLISLGYCDIAKNPVESFASGISASGKVVVGSSTCQGVETPVRWENNLLQKLPLALSGVSGRVEKTSMNGDVTVGWVSPDSDSTPENSPRIPVAWGTSGNPPWHILSHSIAGVSGTSGQATDVSDSGNAIVGFLFDETLGRATSPWPCTWRNLNVPPFTHGVLELLPGPTAGGGVELGMATAISANGTIAVGCIGQPYATSKACRWKRLSETDPFLKPTLIDPLPGDTASVATAVSGDGGLVAGVSIGPQGRRAFVWTENPGNTNELAPIISASLIYPSQLTGWSLETPTAISSDGSVIVGNGTHSGNPEGWVYQYGIYDPVKGSQLPPRRLFVPNNYREWWQRRP